jgi:hypothetical protein
MKKIFIIFLAFIGLISCDDNSNIFRIKVSFERPFPKRAKNLTYKLGDEFSIKHDKDTITYTVSYDKGEQVNIIINKKTNDTIFMGIVNKYRGLYYFNEQINDSSYWIYAVEINNGTIKGLGTNWIQMSILDEYIDKSFLNNSELKGLIKSVNIDTSVIRLTPDKKLLKEFYYSIIDSLPTDTFISKFDYETKTELSNNKNIELINGLNETSNNEMILNLYPNPANDFIMIETDKPDENIFLVTNINGQIFITGKLINKTTKIDVSELQEGTYFIKLDKEDGRTETRKFIIQ